MKHECHRSVRDLMKLYLGHYAILQYYYHRISCSCCAVCLKMQHTHNSIEPGVAVIFSSPQSTAFCNGIIIIGQ